MPSLPLKKTALTAYAVAIVAIILDQLTKFWVVEASACARARGSNSARSST